MYQQKSEMGFLFLLENIVRKGKEIHFFNYIMIYQNIYCCSQVNTPTELAQSN